MINQLMQVAAYLKQAGMNAPSTPEEAISLDVVRKIIGVHEKLGKQFLDAFDFPAGSNELSVNHTEVLANLSQRLYAVLVDAHLLGFGYLLPVAFRLLHNSNMSKQWTEEETLTITNPNYTIHRATGDEKIARKFVVLNPLGRLQRSPSYFPPEIFEILEELKGQELLDYNHASTVVFGDEPEPDIDEPEYPNQDCPF